MDAHVTPNLFIVGAPKSGTSSLHYYLQQHPEIYMSSPKELYCLMDDLQEPLYSKDEYFRFFAAGKDKTYTGESTTIYIYSESALENIKQMTPNAKVIIMVRNPIEIMDSLYWQNVRNGNESRDITAALTGSSQHTHDPKYGYFSGYQSMATLSPHIKRYKEAFGQDLMIINFDRFAEDAAGLTRDVFTFLGVDAGFTPEFKVQNPNAKIRIQWLEKFINKPPVKFVLFMQKLLPSPSFRRWIYDTLKILNHAPSKRPGMDEALKSKLKEEFKEEIATLAEIMNDDLSNWSN